MRPYLASLKSTTSNKIKIDTHTSATSSIIGNHLPRLFMQSCLYQYAKELMRYIHRKVENNGFEPLTPCLQSRCSSQLS